MSYTESFLTRAEDDVRESIDEPVVRAKYTSARVISHLEKSYILVLNEKNRNSKTQIVATTDLTIAAATTAYVLPHVMGTLIGIYDRDDAGGKIFYDGRSPHNPYGQKIWLRGQTLHIQTTDSLGVGTTLTVEWIPMGTARLHNGACTVNADGDEVTLAATPNSGTLDTHSNAYAGSVLRILEVDGTTVTGNVMQERNITAYSNSTRVAELDVALSPVPTTDDGSIYYEIAPAIHKGMDTVVALYAAYRIASVEGNTKRARGILNLYRNELRNVRLSAYYSNMPEAPRVRTDNFDARRYRRY